MSNIIALVWDFDKTLISEYMQTPMFEEYGVDAKVFWDEVNKYPESFKGAVRVNTDTSYLNFLIRYAHDGRFKGLNNEKLKSYGQKLNFYNGVPEIFAETKKLVESESKYKEYDIKVEHYIVSTGTAETIRGSKIMDYIEDVWGCEFAENTDDEGNKVVSEVIYAIDNTSKTRALFEINKGVGRRDGVTVNSTIQEEFRRVRFENMIYIADGPSDIPAFSVVKKGGGATFAIYPKNDEKAFVQVEKMRSDGRVQMYAEADYSKGTTAYMWLTNKVREIADKICAKEKSKLADNTSNAPIHLS